MVAVLYCAPRSTLRTESKGLVFVKCLPQCLWRVDTDQNCLQKVLSHCHGSCWACCTCSVCLAESLQCWPLLLATFVVLFWSHCYLSSFVNFHKTDFPPYLQCWILPSSLFFVHLTISLTFPFIASSQVVCALWETCIVLLHMCNTVMTSF